MKEVIGFFLDGREYGVEISGMQSLEPCQEITPLADAPEGILGTVKVRDEIYPVYDLKAKIGLADSAPKGVALNGTTGGGAGTGMPEDSKLLVLRTTVGNVACVVDGVGMVFQAEGDDLQTFPNIVRTDGTEYVDFVVRRENKLIVVLDPTALLTKEQEEGLKKIDFTEAE